MQPVQLFCWHFMAYPYLDKDFDKSGHSGWVTTPNKLWDNNQARGLYQEYIDQLALADELGFDGWREHEINELARCRVIRTPFDDGDGVLNE